MADNIFAKDSTSKIITVTLRSATTGLLLTGVTYTGITIIQHRQASTTTTITAVTMTAGTWASSGWVETSDAGVYQFGIPNAGIATGAEEVTYSFRANGALDAVRKIILLDTDLRSATNGALNVNTAKVGGQTALASGTVTFPGIIASTTNITAATGIVLSGVTHTGAVIPTVSAVTGLTASNLDATVSSRMATYTQPTGFLATTFPTTVASTTNITAGTITTVTTLTNLPSIPAGWLTTAGIAAGTTLPRVTLVDTTTTNTDMRGTDSAALASVWTPTRGGYLDNLSAGAVATAANLAMVAGYLDTEIAAILEDTGTTIPAQVSALNNLSAGGVRTELATELARIDVAISTRGTGTGTALDAAGVRSAVGLATASLDMQLAVIDADVLTRLATSSYTAPPSAATIASTILAAGDVDGFSLEQTLKLCLAALAGKLSGAATSTITIRAADDSKARITATVDSTGRTAVTLDAAG